MTPTLGPNCHTTLKEKFYDTLYEEKRKCNSKRAISKCLVDDNAVCGGLMFYTPEHAAQAKCSHRSCYMHGLTGLYPVYANEDSNSGVLEAKWDHSSSQLTNVRSLQEWPAGSTVFGHTWHRGLYSLATDNANVFVMHKPDPVATGWGISVINRGTGERTHVTSADFASYGTTPSLDLMLMPGQLTLDRSADGNAEWVYTLGMNGTIGRFSPTRSDTTQFQVIK